MKYKYSLFLFFILMFFNKNGFSILIDKTLYINRGVFTTVMPSTFPYIAFNKEAVFSAQNEVITVSTGDSIKIKIINNDTITHGFDVKNYVGVNQTILPGDTVLVTLYFSTESIWIFYDPLNYPNNRYMGLGGMICVSNATHKKFYWNIKDHETTYNNNLAVGTPVNWLSYYPDYFTINGKSFPDLQNDTSAVPNVNLGDTILIFVANTGQSKHSIHFHGFHSQAIYSLNPLKLNLIKETWPLQSMDGYILRMVMDKLGRYSVHDHNLVAVSGGNIHPNGMFLIMKVE